ncbi:ATPase, T2SS/T4P/T4SS family, partial [Psychrobacter sp. 1U2]
MDFDKLLQLMVKKNGSDLFITAGVAPSMKINGTICPVGQAPLTGEQTLLLVKSLMTYNQQKEFEDTNECQFAISDKSQLARFRVSAFMQRDMAGMVLRKIENKIPTVEELRLPPSLKELAMKKRGIILLVGATGTGKSTTLASMIGHRNQNSHGHI